VKLVIIYGAPGVGKFTTAKALADLTGFRVFHNHLSFDLVKAVFDFPTPPFMRLSETVRLAAFEAAAREKMPVLLFTFAYAAPEDDAFIKKIIQVIEPHEGKAVFVRLFCDRTTHERRVLAEERKRFGKITDPVALRGALKRWNFDSAIPFGDGLEIDNSNVEPEVVARKIAERFALPIRQG
jgi:chloramphenicol 3-O-phosphotransferase